MIEARILAGLPVFRAVAVHGGFTAAAGRLGVTPSAVSQSIRVLEEHLGVRLFARTSRSLRLTEAGTRLLADIDAPLSRLSQATQALRDSEGQSEGPLRVSLSRLALEICIMPQLAQFIQANPAIQLELSTDDRLTDIVKGGFDAGIRLRESLEGDMISLPFGPPLRRVLLASPDYLARHGTPAVPADLIGHRIQRYRFPGSQRLEPLQFRDGDQRLELDPPAAISLDDIRGIGMAVRSGQVIAQSFHAIEEDAINEGRLVELLPKYEPAPVQFHIYYPSRILQTARLRTFLDWFARGRRS
ncbi:LysR substrate-binding domain-containing protein [Paracoccus aerodenitrificans]|uniref:LysR substrate-binding domain-containing protein n=1 Tax=Paracoccus aerodenitrificans TaxID=3017781 RepID=UPI0022F03FFF|nr:LysR substrate-binding domain-containing protein [Paracoccus aerodenitrificans]WBU63711.1 LysR substrate-binding domain-containing protein [Paracoccus aerodenitrificans]